MGAYTITAVCGGETATAVVTIPDLTGDLTVTATVLDASATVTGLSDDQAVTVDWGDGTAPDTVSLTDGAGTATHTYADATGSPYTVTVTGNTSGAVLTADVTVTPPPLTVTATTAADPQTTVTVTGIWAEDTTVTVDYGDAGTPEQLPVTGTAATAAHIYPQNGTYTVTVTGDVTGQTDSADVTIAGWTDVVVDPMTSDAMWPALVYSTALTTPAEMITGDASAEDGNLLRDTGYHLREYPDNIELDPTALYRIAFRVRSSGTTPPQTYLGISGIAADGTTRVNGNGDDSPGAQYFAAAQRATLPESGWTEYVGYLRGKSAPATGGSEHHDPDDPGTFLEEVVYIRPIMSLAYKGDTTAVMDVDTVRLTSAQVPA
ncbi:hypothetical protein ACIRLA_46440 [Streptomyces sp. NPDC102364]|uniref:hypothetical protein n=1 Tax=Streptomyces sp. NPDC102364 TaxID=3366161 RepID=UPI00380C8261